MQSDLSATLKDPRLSDSKPLRDDISRQICGSNRGTPFRLLPIFGGEVGAIYWDGLDITFCSGKEPELSCIRTDVGKVLGRTREQRQLL